MLKALGDWISSCRRKRLVKDLKGQIHFRPGNRQRWRDGIREVLNGCERADLDAGDVFVIETPGGGGFGIAE